MINIKNNPYNVIKMNQKFKFNNADLIDNSQLDELKQIILNDINLNEFEKKSILQKSISLRIWCRNFLDNNGWNNKNEFTLNYDKEIYYLPEILDFRKNGNDGLCSYYARVFMFCCYSFGINCRTIKWWHPGGHILNEVYIPDLQKWIAIDPLYNCIFIDENNNPLNSIEMNYYNHNNNINDLKIERHNCITYPNPQLNSFNLLVYSWDINYFSYNYNYVYQFRNKKHWPYRSIELDIYTFNEDDINYDAALIKIDAKLDKTTNILDIEIVDYFVSDFKEFHCDIIHNAKLVNIFEFKNNIFSLSIDNYEYIINIYASNFRNGKSNIVQITFTE